MGLNRACQITVNFRTDVFHFLFKGKGTHYEHGPGYLYNLEDFDAKYFPSNWHKIYDNLGDGCQVKFPIRIHNKLKWETTVYIRDEATDQLIKKKKSFEEVCTVWLLKERI